MPSPASLLALPPELRDLIFRNALIHAEVIHVWASREDSEETEEPGLLRSCRLIRAEASPLYYNDTFRVHMPGELPNFEHWFWKYVPPANRSVWHCEPPSFTTLKKWLHRYYEGHEAECYTAFAGKRHTYDPEEIAVCWPLFPTVKKMRDIPWEKVEVMLDGCREVMDMKFGYAGKWTFRD